MTQRLIYVLFFAIGLFASFALTYTSSPSSHLFQNEPLSLSSQEQDWLLQQELSIHTIKKQAPDYNAIKKIYKKIKSISSSITKLSTQAEAKENKTKNRYHCFLPFDENRTCREIPGFYLSASDVLTPTQQYIMAQGPLENTAPDFWYALIERNCPLIVTAVMAIEKGNDKCYGYWENHAFPIETHGWVVTPTADSPIIAEEESHRIVKRSFICLHKATQESKTITQLHYENWPDNGIPNFDLFVRLLDEVDEMQIATTTPIAVHCSAGIGRSGTFVAAHSLRKALQQESNHHQDHLINIPKAIIALRLQRPYLIANAEQLQTVYQVLAKD